MNKREIALSLVRDAVAAVLGELGLHERGGGGVSNPQQLAAFQKELTRMLSELESSDLRPLSQRSSSMGRVIVDSWPLGSELGELIIRAEGAYRRA